MINDKWTINDDDDGDDDDDDDDDDLYCTTVIPYFFRKWPVPHQKPLLWIKVIKSLVAKANPRHTWRKSCLLSVSPLILLLTSKGNGCPITCKGRRGVASFYVSHFSVSLAIDGGTYLLSVATLLPFTPPKEGSYQLRLGWPSDALGIELSLPDCESGVLTTALCGTLT